QGRAGLVRRNESGALALLGVVAEPALGGGADLARAAHVRAVDHGAMGAVAADEAAGACRPRVPAHAGVPGVGARLARIVAPAAAVRMTGVVLVDGGVHARVLGR